MPVQHPTWARMGHQSMHVRRCCGVDLLTHTTKVRSRLVMSRYAAVSYSSTHTADIRLDQPAATATASAFSLDTIAWHCGLVANLATHPRD